MADAITENYGWGTKESHGAAEHLNDAVCKLVDEISPRDILDVGCGIGSLCNALAKEGRRVNGMDGDAAGIKIARETYPGIRFEVGRFEDGPEALRLIGDGLVDCVVSTEVVEHLYDPALLARYCYSALRPGGTLIISTPYHGYLKNLALSLSNKWDYHHRPLWHGGHIKFWSRSTLIELLKNAGFTPSEFIGVGRFFYLWKSMIIIARKI